MRSIRDGDTPRTRWELDKKMTDPKYGKKAFDKNLVESTWKGLLPIENGLPDPPGW